MKLERSGGVLLHPTSLPGKYGIGDLGPTAHKWLDFLAESGCRLWQVLPLGPTGYGDSPYQSFSAFGGNPYLISPELLSSDDLLSDEDLDDRPDFPVDYVDYGAVIGWKLKILRRAYDNFRATQPPQLAAGLEAFMKMNLSWLPDFTLFMALKEAHQGAPWTEWPPGLRDRKTAVVARARQEFADAIRFHAFLQYLFAKQWHRLREHAAALRIQIIGDMPIFVAHDSADVWSNRQLFVLDREGQPTAVAGVPPDYFSPTGQLWGNPLYRWKLHAKTDYAWWIDRFENVLKLVDIVRLDHFRGFAGYWEVPAGSETAETGRWRSGPSTKFFRRLKRALGDLPIIAEDLGEITSDVIKLRDRFKLPGMKVLVFAFSEGPENEFLPHAHVRNCVVYTGTHDNDTTQGWYKRISEEERDFCHRYLNTDGAHIAWDMIRAAWASVAVFALAPMQDLLELGNEARMNYPGKQGGYWSWRMSSEALEALLGERLRELNYLYDRSGVSTRSKSVNSKRGNQPGA